MGRKNSSNSQETRNCRSKNCRIPLRVAKVRLPAGRNIIAAETEKVFAALASQSFSRAEFLKKLDRFYLVIEHPAGIVSRGSELAVAESALVRYDDTHSGVPFTPLAS